MGSGRANTELTHSAKKVRERKRREKNQRKRLLAMGVSEEIILSMTSKAIREMVTHPKKLRAILYSAHGHRRK